MCNAIQSTQLYYYNIKDTFFWQNVTSRKKNILSGQRFLLGICVEIERDPNVKHAIITDSDIIPPLEVITSKQNVCFLKDFQNTIHKNMPFPRIDKKP